MSFRFVVGSCLLLTLSTVKTWGAIPQWEGDITLEGRTFASSPGSLSRVEPALTARLRNEALLGLSDVAFGAWLRVDPVNPERIRVDASDISWHGSAGDLDVSVGLRTVFWGVLESSHLVDVINQRDLDERWPRRETLSQLMFAATWTTRLGVIDLYLLPWTRTRPFAGHGGRLWSDHPIDASINRFTQSTMLRHLSWAARWSVGLAAWDVGITYFEGTARDPRFEPSGTDDTHALVPTYDRVRQFGGDIQYTGSSWLWKLEIVTANPVPGHYLALGSGIEYSPADYLSLFLEFLLDTRGLAATTSLEHDFFAGFRLLFQDGSLVGGTAVDASSGNVIGSVEAQRRFGSNLVIGIAIRGFAGCELCQPPHAMREETSVSLFVKRYL